MRTGLPVKGESLAGVELFSDLDLDARNAIATRCTGSEFELGDIILHHMESGRDVHFVISGVVEVSLFSVNGRRITFDDKGSGQMVGELSAIDGQPRSAHVTAKTSCHTATISPDEFRHVLATYPSVALRALNRLTRQVRNLSERVFEFNALCVGKRIHVELLRSARSGSADGSKRIITPVPTHADIASRVSTHREAVTREISYLTKEGIIEKAKDALIVTDIGRLEELVQQSLGDIPVIC
jgi:CRP/FNR family cyclic AMP-dependent transcriptional regulator